MTKPQRSASKGRDPSLGLSLKAVHIAFIDEKPAKERGVIAASEPEYIYIYYRGAASGIFKVMPLVGYA